MWRNLKSQVLLRSHTHIWRTYHQVWPGVTSHVSMQRWRLQKRDRTRMSLSFNNTTLTIHVQIYSRLDARCYMPTGRYVYATSHPKRSTISLHHRQKHYWVTAFEKQFNWVTDLHTCKRKTEQIYTTIHTNWKGTLGHISSTASPQKWFSRWNTVVTMPFCWVVLYMECIVSSCNSSELILLL